MILLLKISRQQFILNPVENESISFGTKNTQINDVGFNIFAGEVIVGRVRAASSTRSCIRTETQTTRFA